MISFKGRPQAKPDTLTRQEFTDASKISLCNCNVICYYNDLDYLRLHDTLDNANNIFVIWPLLLLLLYFSLPSIYVH